MLTDQGVAPYLLERGLLQPQDIVDGALAIRDTSSRNHNYAVERSPGPSYLLKQGVGDEGAATVANEAAMYQLLAGLGPRMQRFVPRCFGYDPGEGVLVLEFVGAGEDLRRHHLRLGALPPAVAEAMGRALGSLHTMTAGAPPAADPGLLAPWVLLLHKPDVAIFREASAASLELIRILQGADGFGAQLEALRSDWTLSCYIHYDVKFDNFIAEDAPPGGPPGVRLVDWETAMCGDPCWDIGSVFSHFLSTWLNSIPVTGQDPPERFPELAAFPLERMFPAIRACWRGYADELGLGAREQRERLLRAVRLGAARLVHSAFEAAQMSTGLTSGIVLHLQLAHNMLARPEVALVHLLGLPEGGAP